MSSTVIVYQNLSVKEKVVYSIDSLILGKGVSLGSTVYLRLKEDLLAYAAIAQSTAR